jgi:OmpA-OmpF porin, OOP family
MNFYTMTALAVLALACTAGEAAAQGVPRSPILGGSISEIQSAVDQRYQAALAQTLAPEIVAKNDPRYTWASEAKVACGIALGYLKTKTIDEESINKCDEFARRMTIIPAPPPPPPARPAPPTPPPAPRPVAPPAPACTIQLPVLIYFDFDVDAPSPEAKDVIAKVVQSMNTCGWSGLSVTGHADRSGSDAYNQKLSERRARNVAGLVGAAGIANVTVDAKGESAPAVPTPDGVREPLNRRVEVNATSRR